MAKPKLLMMGAYAAWDMDDLEANYDVLKYWEAPDRDAFAMGKLVRDNLKAHFSGAALIIPVV